MAVEAGFRDAQEAAQQFRQDLAAILSSTRGIDKQEWTSNEDDQAASIEDVILAASHSLRNKGERRRLDADALDDLHDKIIASKSYGGLDISRQTIPTTEQYKEILFQTEAHLESVNSQTKSRDFLQVSNGAIQGARPMTLAQKVFTQHALSGIPSGTHGLAVGDVIRAGVDWVLASELSWSSMAQTYEELNDPGIWRNDRFWLAGDHLVHPTITEVPKIKAYIETAEKAKKNFRMTQYQGSNYTIMHTEFVRERAEPGMLIVGSDSHSCSAGAVGCLSIGLGSADVMMTLALGETWFKVPESISIELVGKPSFAISGKDVILHILKELKRNTVAAERIVEFSGEGAQYLSSDARFAICNMCTEFGAITGVFVPDAVTQDYIGRRKRKANKSSSLYFKPDADAPYAERCTIDLSKVEPTIAVYPEPDNVVPVSQQEGMHLDGVFIGACTTTEEELVLGALVLKVGLQKGLPLAKGNRHYVPGSLPIVEKLKELGLLEVYEAAGFTRGPPGCSMCVGLTAEKAGEGETWLSSQNRNFENRMGKGAFGHLASAVTCAASSFSMKITDPAPLLKDLDVTFFNNYRGITNHTLPPPTYSSPQPPADGPHQQPTTTTAPITQTPTQDPVPTTITSKITTLPDFIDTDALSPGFTLTTCTTDAEFGAHVLCHTHPDFRSKVSSGHRVVVAGHAFGVGSSRETAVSALKGAGVQAVIAKSFAFIYGRNQPSLGLLGIVMEDEAFYAVAKEGCEISIDLPGRRVLVEGRTFGFGFSRIEEELLMNRGVTNAYRRYGKGIWEKLTEKKGEVGQVGKGGGHEGMVDSRLKW
ncbi:hypothetical protein PRZ48_011751 [Zasmidium cellare]|uniref:Aconitase family protein n=1 Tax=Zasmidium cellare TaxID=395010 RepID=A0ABR0E7W1_ZASCE|nr:hypothetical protein PRZ48_011751 [Zasmidium cellare]